MENTDYISEITSKLLADITNKKDLLIKDRIFGILGYELDIQAEGRRRFCRIKMESHSNDMSEHWYWNDGSESGLRIISFYSSFEDMKITDGFKMTSAFTYK